MTILSTSRSPTTLEDRVAAFAASAEARLPSGDRLQREIASLRRFLFRSQAHRFTDRERARLMSAITSHYANPATSTGAAAGGEVPMLGLLQDALAMPHCVFTTANKQLMLRWLAVLQSGNAAGGSNGASAAVPAHRLACIDLSPEGYCSLLLHDGSGTRDDVLVPPDARAQLVAALARGGEVYVLVRGGTFGGWGEGGEGEG